MDLQLNTALAEGYSSASQRSRIMTEGWVQSHVFCSRCGNPDLHRFPNNAPVADFYCRKCGEEFELKSMRAPLKGLITDGAYESMLSRLQSNNNPNLYLLVYDRNFTVNDFLVIPKDFFLPETIIRRPPLNPPARRAGWVGCNINISAIADAGKVFYVKNKSIIPPEFVVENYNKTFFLRESKLDQKRWTIEIIKIVNKFNNNQFSLKEIYAFADDLQLLFPENKHIKAKIRQQLQILRDNGYISFVGRGLYRKL